MGGKETGVARAGEVFALVLVWSFPNEAGGSIVLESRGVGTRVSIRLISSILQRNVRLRRWPNL